MIAKISSGQNINQVSVTGRINRFDVYEGKHYTEVIIPVADEYSNPGRVKVVSTRPLVSVGQSVIVDCSIRGYVHTSQSPRDSGPVSKAGRSRPGSFPWGISADGPIQQPGFFCVIGNIDISQYELL